MVPIRRGNTSDEAHVYVVCPSLAAVLSRVEQQGAMDRLQAAYRSDATLRALLDDAARLLETRRIHLLDTITGVELDIPRPGAGLGGPGAPDAVSCLHALAATLLTAETLGNREATAAGYRVASEAKLAWGRLLPPIEECWCRDARCSARRSAPRRGVIVMDGSGVRLLVADVVNGHAWGVLREFRPTRLAQDLLPGELLDDGSRRRTAKAVVNLAEEAHAQGVENLLLAGTHEVLQARDGESFLYDVAHEVALPVAVLSATREAEFTHAGVSMDVHGRVVVLEVGDRISTLIASSASGPVESWRFEWGAGRAGEAFITTDPPSVQERAQIYSEVAGTLEGARRQFGAYSDDDHLVGVGGAVAALACMDGRVEFSRFKALHLRRYPVGRIRAVAEHLSSMTTEDRAELPWVEPWRAPTVVAGAVIVQAVMETLGYRTLTYSRRDLLDGLVLWRM
ncbi:MAG: DUF501 domain-containing protein [Thermoleophilia bacterium]|nr:DUF501 domain-containing protein [Thermoleophilia bacterium]